MNTIDSKLEQHRLTFKDVQLVDLFTQNPKHVEQWTFSTAGIYADLSKNFVNEHTKALWRVWLDARQVQEGINAITRGDKVNVGEHRPALHHRLRAPTNEEFLVDGENVSEHIAKVREQMQDFSQRIRQGEWLGYSGKPITDIIHIGIGGSELGPRLLCEAFAHQADGHLSVHFLASPDPTRLAELKKSLNPETTIIIIASKSFGTEETLVNANFMRDWLRYHGGDKADKQMIAISANVDKAVAFGIAKKQILPFWDWVGGRFSLWSAISLPFVLQNGYAAYQELLDGAHAMDQHFQQTDLMQNMPVQLALLDAWYNHYFAVNNRAVIMYCNPMRSFAQYLQQLDMESLGKRANLAGEPLNKPSGLIIWGGTGTESQHAFFQLLHQGQRLVPIDFVTVKEADDQFARAQRLVLGHCLAQSEALMRGRDEDDLQDVPKHERYQRTCAGNRPSTTIILDSLSPKSLGAFIALFEHKITVLALLYGVNAYDQWGVELGKVLARGTQESLSNLMQAHDPSTTALINHLKS